MTKYLAIAFLITGFLMGNAYGEEEVFYCAETSSIGFKWSVENNRYGPSAFLEEKFKIKLDKASNTVDIKHKKMEGKYICTQSEYDKDFNMMRCNDNHDQFSFNASNGHFVIARAIGYLPTEDIVRLFKWRYSLVISYGTCDKFD